LLDEVWGSVHVTPGVVGHAITALRRAFGDDLERPAYIETIPRIGYRLVAAVQALDGLDADPPGPAGTGPEDAPPATAAAVGAGGDPVAAADVATSATGPAVATVAPAPPRSVREPGAWTTPWRQPATLLAVALALGLAFLAAIVWQRAERTSPPGAAAVAAEPARRITFAPGSETTPRLNPGGDWLVYTRREHLNDVPRLFLQSLHGTEPIALADGDHAERPAWSPNGREVAYV